MRVIATNIYNNFYDNLIHDQLNYISILSYKLKISYFIESIDFSFDSIYVIKDLMCSYGYKRERILTHTNRLTGNKITFKDVYYTVKTFIYHINIFTMFTRIGTNNKLKLNEIEKDISGFNI